MYWMLASFDDLQLIASLSQTPQCYNPQWLYERIGDLLLNWQQMFWSLKLKATCFIIYIYKLYQLKHGEGKIIIFFKITFYNHVFPFTHLLKFLWVTMLYVTTLLSQNGVINKTYIIFHFRSYLLCRNQFWTHKRASKYVIKL